MVWLCWSAAKHTCFYPVSLVNAAKPAKAAKDRGTSPGHPMRRLSVCLALWYLVVATGFAAAPPGKVPAEWLKLIDQLGDDETRGAAAAKLDALGEDALPALRRAGSSHADVDVRLRAGVVAAAIEARLYGLAKTLTGGGTGDCGVVVSPDGKWAVTGGDRDARVWDVRKGVEVRQLKGHTEGVVGLAMSPDGKLAATGGGDGAVRIWDVASGKQLHLLRGYSAFYGYVSTLAFTPDGKRLLTGQSGAGVRAHDVRTGEEVWKAALGNPRVGGVRHLAVSGDGKRVLVGILDGHVVLLDATNGKKALELTRHDKGVMAVALSPDGKVAAAGGFEGAIHLHDLKTGKVIRTLKAEEWVKGLAFTSDSRRLLSGGHGGVVRLWDVQTGKVVFRGEGHKGAVWGVCLFGGDRMAASSGEDGTVKLWRLPR